MRKIFKNCLTVCPYVTVMLLVFSLYFIYDVVFNVLCALRKYYSWQNLGPIKGPFTKFLLIKQIFHTKILFLKS